MSSNVSHYSKGTVTNFTSSSTSTHRLSLVHQLVEQQVVFEHPLHRHRQYVAELDAAVAVLFLTFL